MDKFEFDGEIYYCNRGAIYDSTFIGLLGEENQKVRSYYFSNIFDVNKLQDKEICLFIKDCINAGDYYRAKDVLLKKMEELSASEHWINTFLPILSSIYRKMNQPQNSVALLKDYSELIWGNPAFCTSIGAAFCDLEDKENALKYAGIANNIYKDKKKPKSEELFALYSRINKMD